MQLTWESKVRERDAHDPGLQWLGTLRKHLSQRVWECEIHIFSGMPREQSFGSETSQGTMHRETERERPREGCERKLGKGDLK